LNAHPEVARHAGDLERIVTKAWIELLTNNDPLSVETVRRIVDELRAELQGDTPTALEKLLVGQVVTSWLAMSHAHIQESSTNNKSLAESTFHLKQSESALKRYLSTVRTLTTIRALLPQGLVPAKPLQVFEPEKKKLA
jgi:hypothetical protein